MKQTTDHQIFCYTDEGNPSNGAWVDLDGITDLETAQDHLKEQGFGLYDDIKVLEAKGFARHFHDIKAHTFDLYGYMAFAEVPDHIPEEALEAFIEWQGLNNALANLDSFEDAYVGEYPSRSDFAREIMGEKVANLDPDPDLVIDWEETANMLDVGDYHIEEVNDAHYAFRNM